MSTNASNALVGVTGAAYSAPVGTALPTDNTTALNVAFVDLGYISDAGVIEKQATTTAQIKAWQNGDTVREVQTDHTLTYQFAMIETKSDALKAFYGDDKVTPGVGSAYTAEISGEQGNRGPWVFSVVDGAHTIRIVVPDGQVTAKGDVVYKSDTVLTYDVTVTCYPDASGNKAYIYGN